MASTVASMRQAPCAEAFASATETVYGPDNRLKAIVKTIKKIAKSNDIQSVLHPLPGIEVVTYVHSLVGFYDDRLIDPEILIGQVDFDFMRSRFDLLRLWRIPDARSVDRNDAPRLCLDRYLADARGDFSRRWRFLRHVFFGNRLRFMLGRRLTGGFLRSLFERQFQLALRIAAGNIRFGGVEVIVEARFDAQFPTKIDVLERDRSFALALAVDLDLRAFGIRIDDDLGNRCQLRQSSFFRRQHGDFDILLRENDIAFDRHGRESRVFERHCHLIADAAFIGIIRRFGVFTAFGEQFLAIAP